MELAGSALRPGQITIAALTHDSSLRLISALARPLCLLATLAAVPAPAVAQPACAPGGFENDGFVTVQGDRLMLGGQPFRVRGATFTGGRGTPAFPLQELEHPDGSMHWEEVYPNRQWTDYDSARTYAELAFLKNRLGINAVRLKTPPPASSTPPYGPPGGWFLPDGSIDPAWLAKLQDTLCSCRRLGIKVQVPLLFNIENWMGGYANLPYPPEFMQFLDTYLASVVPVFASDPAVLSWEISNEVLIWGDDDPVAAPTQEHLEAAKLIRHLIQQVRSHDSSHLITSGEVAVPLTHAHVWRYPTPELYRFDLDGTGVLTGLVDYVDYISPHFYSFGVHPFQNGTFDYGPMRPVIEEIKRRTGKPIVMGEMNRAMSPGHLSPDEDDPIRAIFFEFARDGAHNACRQDPTCPAGAHPGMSGFLAWQPEPILDLRPGSYVREWHCAIVPPDNKRVCDNPWPFIRFLDPPRGVHYNDSLELLYYPDDNPATHLQPLAPGRIFRKALHAPADFGADGTSDIAVYRPSAGQWLVSGKGSATYGAPGDIPVGVDWNGDGRSETVVFRPVSQNPSQPAAEWWFPANENDLSPILFGRNSDIPVPGDYDGDGDAEIAVFRPHSDSDPNVAAWHVRDLYSNLPVYHGLPTDIPVPADYDGDGAVDIAVFRPSAAAWFVLGTDPVTHGTPGDIPIPGDYDADGDDDMAVFRPSTGQWLVRGMLALSAVVVPPLPGDLPVPADYDGDSKIDFAVFRPSTGQWFLADGTTVTFGDVGDIPVVRRPQY